MKKENETPSLTMGALIDATLALPASQRSDFLYDNGADLYVDDCGQTILHAIAEHRDEEAFTLIKTLASLGADVNKEDDNATTPLALSVMHGSADVVRALLEEGARVDVLNMNYATPLHLAASHHRVDVIPVLIAAGADLHAINRHGTSVVGSVFKDLYPYVQGHEHYPSLALMQLLNAGIPLETKNGDQRTLLHLAEIFGTLEQFQTLIEMGADVNARDIKGYTALHSTTLNNRNIDRALMLLAAGADPCIKDYDGVTARDLAKKVNNRQWISEIDAFLASKAARQAIDEMLSQNTSHHQSIQ